MMPADGASSKAMCLVATPLASLQHYHLKQDSTLLIGKSLQACDYLPNVFLACRANGVAVEPAIPNLRPAVKFVQRLQRRENGLEIGFLHLYPNLRADLSPIYVCTGDMPSDVVVPEPR